MYRRTTAQLLLPEEFRLPFGGALNPANRWVRIAGAVDWWTLEENYAACFKKSNRGKPAYGVRVALGALIIQNRLKLTDAETVASITENPYMQYLLGFEAFDGTKPPFSPSQMVRFRKRLDAALLRDVNKTIRKALRERS